ncbi:nitrate/nitrite transporter [Corynebacterium kutscheri]|uniref:Nitrate/nitrite transporter n=1 Tax=Corynebacterium kutscheri TaxID=35755 RepID=A0A0F6R3E1_9CORY|nr:MFS transporter [Corynebacterium kutscheri]AKE42243.1 nitrate/nitrite transporter [Corynebacterium kutscheri]VEH05689.1 nitrate/nitrite transporter [Corynebacterium kutscheri]VEH10586.1 nitrate/nitrite transporter [Corynebacterium kutscheri]VEH81584.1 nitrate/nitrite transporter [Corynebacterium kutscheri]
MSTKLATDGDWLRSWDPEDEKSWDKSLAWNTLAVTTVSLTLCFVAWFLPSAIVPKMGGLGYQFTSSQLYWLAAMPGLSGGLLRLMWMVLPPIMGTRKMVSLTTALLLLPMLGWGFAIQSLNTPYWVFLLLAFLAGIGGGAFSGFMPSTSFFFPKRMSGTALGIQAGVGNFGVSFVQLLTPWLIGFSMFGLFGASQTFNFPGREAREVWYQTVAFIYVPIIIAVAIWAYIVLRSVPIKANVRQQFDIFGNQDTWWMTLLYILTFGTFSGLSAQFGLLMSNLYGQGNAAIVSGSGSSAQVLIDGYSLPDPVKYVFLGPLIGAGARVLFSPLTDRMGGAIWTLISSVGILGSIIYTIPALTPDLSSAETLKSDFNHFLWGMLLIFLFAGIGNASTFKQMPMIFEKRQAGGVIGWTSAIAAFGPFLFGIGLSIMSSTVFFAIGAVWSVLCIIITWLRYARRNAPKPS